MKRYSQRMFDVCSGGLWLRIEIVSCANVMISLSLFLLRGCLSGNIDSIRFDFRTAYCVNTNKGSVRNDDYIILDLTLPSPERGEARRNREGKVPPPRGTVVPTANGHPIVPAYPLL